MNTIRVPLLPHQQNALASRKQAILLVGGVGAGKTHTGAAFSLLHANVQPADSLGAILASSYAQLHDAVLAPLYRLWRSWGVRMDPVLKPKSKGPVDIRLWTETGWRTILCRSLDNYEALSGIQLAWFWVDEAFLATREALEVLEARLRDPAMPAEHRQALYTTTPDAPGSVLHTRFVEEFDPARHDIIYTTTFDNPYLPRDYVLGLKRLYSAKLYDRMILSKWVSLDGQGIYHAFDRSKNAWDGVDFEPMRPIAWSHDFNIAAGKPMSSILGQVHPGPHGPELHVFDEIVIETADTNDVITEFKGRPWLAQAKAGVIIYGDAAGRARDTRSKQTDYTLLAQAGFGLQKVPRTNPPLRTRHNTVNAMLCNANGEVRIRIHPRCATLLRGLERARLKPGAMYIEDDAIPEQHITTALGYLCCEERALRIM